MSYDRVVSMTTVECVCIISATGCLLMWPANISNYQHDQNQQAGK